MRIASLAVVCVVAACSPPEGKHEAKPKRPTPNTPCHQHAAMIEAEDDPHQRHKLEAAWAFFETIAGSECPYEVRWRVVEKAVKSLDDKRDLRPQYVVADAAVKVLEVQTGLAQEDWRTWWKGARDDRDEILSASKGARLARREQQVREGTLHVERVWRLREWKNEKLEPKFLVEGMRDASFDAPMLPVVREEVQWGWYLKKDGVIHHVQRVSHLDGSWHIKATAVNTTSTIESAIPPAPDLFVWPYSKELPLAGIKSDAPLKPMPAAFIDGIKTHAPVHWNKLLEKSVLTINVVDGDVIARLQIRAN